MRINAEHTHNAASVGLLKTYGDKSAAITLLTSADSRVATGLARVFSIHSAPFLDMEKGLDWDLDSVGDCVIKDNSVKIVIEGDGKSFMGMLFETEWDAMDRSWRSAAEFNGCVWLALADFEVYDRIKVTGLSTPVPIAVPILKLDTVS